MRNTFAIAKRELDAYFASPIAYVVSAAILAIFGYFFSIILFFSKQASLRQLFSQITVVFIFVIPLLTMRLLAEERRSGTIELLLTSPVRDWEVILGKFLASFGLYVLMLVPTLYYVLVLKIFGNPDGGPIVSVYLGLLLLGAALLSLGTFASALTSNQIVSAMLGVGLILIWWLIPSAAEFVNEPAKGILTYLGLSSHFFDLAKGVIDTRDVVFYLSVIAGALFLATRALETRRWR